MSKPRESVASIRDGSDGDSIRFYFGQHARHVPMWMYVQDQGKGVVSFVGSSRGAKDDLGLHQLRYGSERTHQFIMGELVVRPHLLIATDSLQGMGLAGLATGEHDLRRMLAKGEMLYGAPEAVRRLKEQGELD